MRKAVTNDGSNPGFLRQMTDGGMTPFAYPFDLMLGERFRVKGGLVATLVEAAATAATPSNLAYKWSDTDTFKVVITAGTGQQGVGFAPDSQQALVATDFFWLLSGPGGRCNVIAGAAISAGDVVQPSTGGKCITDAAYEAHVSAGVALEAAAADGDQIGIMISDTMPGANA